HGERFGWLTFDPVTRRFRFDLVPEALPFVLDHATRGVVDLAVAAPGAVGGGRRIGGKRVPVSTREPDGTVIVRHGSLAGTGVLREGQIRVRELRPVASRTLPDPGWEVAVDRNRYHLKNLERHAVRAIRQHLHDLPCVNVSFSGGKDSTAVLHLARKAGVTEAFFLDTGIEFPETVAFVEAQGVPVIRKAGDFWAGVEKAGPPAKDHRWCCKMLKLHPLKIHLASTGPCVTIQGNRWYESWNRADLELESRNPANPLQVNISPIRHWRALEVFLYLWWRGLPVNPLYAQGIERIGCYLCPAMLESEHEALRRMHPDLAARWDGFLERWTREKGLPPEYARWGLWRWKDLPPKMRELVSRHGVDLSPRPPPETSAPAPLTVSAGEGDIRGDFPLIADLVHLDSADTSICPEPVLQVLTDVEHHFRANVGRGVHRLTQIASQRYWQARKDLAGFIGAQGGMVVFTRDAFDALVMVARGIAWQPGDRVVTTLLEPDLHLGLWEALRAQGVDVTVIPPTGGLTIDPMAVAEAITPGTRLVAAGIVSGATGTILPVGEIAGACHRAEARLLLDGSHAAVRMPLDVEASACDYLALDGHRMLGPTGTGALWMREADLEPRMVGGGMVETVTLEGFRAVEGPERYEAGTQNIAGTLALGAAAQYLEKAGRGEIRTRDWTLADALVRGLRKIPGVRVHAPEDPAFRTGIVSFTVEGLDPADVARYLDETADVLVGAGDHGYGRLMAHLGLPAGTVRASTGPYTTAHDIEVFLASLAEMLRA
ncbi:MAG: putative cysteine desulfurase, partial [Methanomicrobia archaeon]|nr:putative cysteine desulfurase [Methanomicrobia archaeon]